MLARRIAARIALLTVIATAGCMGETVAGPEIVFEGTYHLRAVGGFPLPFVIAGSETRTVSIVAQVLVLEEDGTYLQTSTLELREGGKLSNETLSGLGTYETLRNTIRFTSAGTESTTFNGTVDGRILTITDGAIATVFERE